MAKQERLKRIAFGHGRCPGCKQQLIMTSLAGEVPVCMNRLPNGDACKTLLGVKGDHLSKVVVEG